MSNPIDKPTDGLSSSNDAPVKRGRGRPKKTEIIENKKGNGKNPVGRPKGDAAIINEYKARMLASPKSRKVLDAIFDAALDNEHKNQAAAWKLVMDRILPTSAFEQELSKGASRNAIQINITGVGGVNVGTPPEDDIIDAEVIDAD